MPQTQNQRQKKDELLSTYSDPEWCNKYVEISYLVDFLSGCILKKDYKVPDQLNAAIVLSAAGQQVHQALVTKNDVNPKDARVMCLLEMAYLEPLIDIDKLDLKKLELALHQQIVQRQILFANRYGRELYDRAAALAEDETPVLSHHETLELLDGSPTGFFQLGHYTIGPFGLQRSIQQRWLPPTRAIPLYHCADLTCNDVHRANLLTDENAKINEDRHYIKSILRQKSDKPSEWAQFMSKIIDIDRLRHDDRSMSSVHFLLGDAFTTDELAIVGSELATTYDNELFEPLYISLGVDPSIDGLKDRPRSDLLQLALLHRDANIVATLDDLVRHGRVVVPQGEIRRPVTNRQSVTGRFGLVPQLSRYGARFSSRTEGIAPLRLRRLVQSLYLLDDASDISELEWQLRGTEGNSLGDKLDRFMRETAPDLVLRRLVLGRRTNLIAACAELEIDDSLYESDDQFVELLLWKLGFRLRRESDFNSSFWSLHLGMQQILQTASASATVDEQSIRGMTGNYFVALEGVLSDSLAFATWALTSDHLDSISPFIFRPDDDGQISFEKLNSHASTNSAALKKRLSYIDDATTLYPLCRGFEVLSKILTQLQQDEASHLRPDDDLPNSAKYSTLRIFPFRHRETFLDLTTDSQSELIELLEKTSDLLLAGNVTQVRNSWSHYRRATTTIEPLALCLANIELAVRGLETAGLCRVLYSYHSDNGDVWDRTIFEMRDPRGRSLTLERPSRFDWARMPTLGSPQYMVTGARIGGPGEFLRFGAQVASPYTEMWNGYPIRRRAGKARSDLAAEGRQVEAV